VFDPLEAAWDQSLEALRLVAEGNGSTLHPHIRAKKLIYEQKNDTYAEVWTQSFEALRLVAEGNG